MSWDKAPLPVMMLLRCPSDMEYSRVICDPGIQNTSEILRKASAGIQRVQREALPSLLSKIRPQTDAEEAIKSLGGLVFFFCGASTRSLPIGPARPHPFCFVPDPRFGLPGGGSRYFQVGGASPGGAAHVPGWLPGFPWVEGATTPVPGYILGLNCLISEF